MTRNLKLSKAIADAGFSCCSFTMPKMPLDVRKWTCSECGVAHGRDINAARNTAAAGLAVLAHGEPVDPETQHAA